MSGDGTFDKNLQLFTNEKMLEQNTHQSDSFPVSVYNPLTHGMDLKNKMWDFCMDSPHENIKRHFKGVWSADYRVTNEVFHKEE